MIICVNNAFIHSTTREIQIYFRSCMANSKRKFKLLCAKLSSSLKYIKVRTALSAYLFLWFYFVALSGAGLNGLVHYNFLIKMLIRWCLMWEGLFLLYRNFLFKTQISWILPTVLQKICELCWENWDLNQLWSNNRSPAIFSTLNHKCSSFEWRRLPLILCSEIHHIFKKSCQNTLRKGVS